MISWGSGGSQPSCFIMADCRSAFCLRLGLALRGGDTSSPLQSTSDTSISVSIPEKLLLAPFEYMPSSSSASLLSLPPPAPPALISIPRAGAQHLPGALDVSLLVHGLANPRLAARLHENGVAEPRRDRRKTAHSASPQWPLLIFPCQSLILVETFRLFNIITI